MVRLTRMLCATFIFAAVIFPSGAYADDETGSGILTAYGGSDGISMFRFGPFGSGLFPYRTDAPGATPSITLHGIPLDPFSPFGPDMESTPFDAGLSIFNRGNIIGIAHPDTVIDRPLSSIDFLSGPQRRSRFIGVFRRAIGDSAEIDMIGISDGLRRSKDVPGSGFRRYELSYLRLLGFQGAKLRFTASGDRDRSDVFDIEEKNISGDRRIDNIRFSGSLTGIPVRHDMAVSAVWSMRSGTAHFKRNGIGDSFGDDSVHGEFRLYGTEKRWEASIAHNGRAFADRHGGDSRRYGTTSVRLGDIWTFHSLNMRLSGAALHAIEHGMGYDLDADMEIRNELRTFFLKGSFASTFPGPEHEFYSVYSFSDTTRGIKLGKFNETSAEVGMKTSKGSSGMEIALFGGSVDMPRFVPSPVTMKMSGIRPFAGFRAAVFGERQGTTVVRTRISFDYTALDGADCLWPRPYFRTSFRTDATRRFYRGNILSNGFLNARFLRWQNKKLDPDGFGAYIDLGVTARVSSLELYYTLENITDTRTVWFDTFRSQGFNAFWGLRWSLRD